MLISATGRNRPRTPEQENAGFSLMEMMVVVFVIALASTAVIMSLPEPRPGAHKQAETLSRELIQASRESIIGGEPIAWSAQPDGYRFLRYRDGDWLPMGLGKSLSGPDTSEDKRVRIAVTSMQDVETVSSRSFRTRAEEEEARAAALPDIIFYPAGEATPAEIVLDQGGLQAIILVEEDASIRIAGQDAAGQR